ncbi:MAG TPA: DedA family protein [Candidatus Nitrosotenuis sp.]|nr:DedA family protein [Candidatus Nitrosotenuis sp.]
MLETLVQWVTALVSDYLYGGVFIGAIIATTIPIIPSEVLYPLAGFVASQNHMSVFEVALVGLAGGAGATVASIALYVISLKLGRDAILKHLRHTRISEKRLVKAEQWFERYGEKMVFFCRMVPVLRELISIPAGLLGMRPVKFLIYTFAGSCVWSIGWTFLGFYFGKTINIF